MLQFKRNTYKLHLQEFEDENKPQETFQQMVNLKLWNTWLYIFSRDVVLHNA